MPQPTVPPTPEAANELVITLQWENKKVFRMKAKAADGTKTIIEMEENGCLPLLWPNAEALAKSYFQREIEAIGAEMKKL